MRLSQEQRQAILMKGGVASVVLLVALMALQHFEVRAMTLELHWVAIAALPILIALFVAEYVNKVDAFGVKLERAMEEAADQEAPDDPATVEVRGTEAKGRVSDLDAMDPRKKAQATQLTFIAGANHHYVPSAIRKYLEAMPRVETFLVLGASGRFVGSLSVQGLRTQGGSLRQNEPGRFVSLLDNDDPAKFASTYPDHFSTHALSPGIGVSEAYKYCLDNRLDRVAVVSGQGIYAGFFSRTGLSEQIARKAMKALEEETGA